jgi:hypothetical protein
MVCWMLRRWVLLLGNWHPPGLCLTRRQQENARQHGKDARDGEPDTECE